MSEAPRVLAYAWDHEGLGHVSRLLNILHGVRELRPDTEIGIVAEQDSDLLRRSGFRYVSVPGHPDSYVGRVPGVVRGELPLERAVAAATVRAAVEVVRPTVALHDSVVSADLLREAPPPDVAHALVLRRNTFMGEFLKSLGPHIDDLASIILPHRPDEVSRGEIPAGLRGRVTFTGPIVRPVIEGEVAELRRHYGVSETDRMVVITGGGGGFADQYLFVESAARAVERTAVTPTVCVLVLGYFFRGIAGLPGDCAAPVSWRVTRHEPELATLMRAADIVITQGGYNTLFEARAAGARVVAVPGTRATDDQTARVRRMARDDPNVVPADARDTDAIVRAVGTLKGQAERRPVVDLSAGRRRAAEAVVGLVSRRSPARPRALDWDQHVLAMPSGTPFQRTGWLRARAASHRERLHLLRAPDMRWVSGVLVSSGSGAPVAWVPRGPAGYSAADVLKAIDATEEAFPDLPLTVSPYLAHGHGAEEVEAALRARGYVDGPAKWEAASVVINVGDADDVLMWRMSKNKRSILRQQLDDPAITVTEDVSDDGLREFERMYRRFAESRPVSPMPTGYLTHLRDHGLGDDLGTVLLCWQNGELCSGQLLLRCGDLAWGSRAPHWPGRPPLGLTLQWRSVRWAREHGCLRYDLGGIVLEDNNGVSDFKRGTGGAVLRTVPSLRRDVRRT